MKIFNWRNPLQKSSNPFGASFKNQKTVRAASGTIQRLLASPRGSLWVGLAAGLLAGSILTRLLRRANLRRSNRQDRSELVDAYNTNDMQAPLEEGAAQAETK